MGIDEHVRTLSALLIIMGIICGVSAIVGMLIFGSPYTMIVEAAQAGTAESMQTPLLRMYGAGVILLGLLLAWPLIATGRGLRIFKPSSRDATMVLCALLLLYFPLGTMLALYGFWVMLSPEIEPLFSSRDQRQSAPR